MDAFWSVIAEQLSELKTAKTADDVLSILSRERNPYGDASMIAGDGFFAGSGGDGTIMGSLAKAGWQYVWWEASYYWAAKAPNGDIITYIEGDVYRGDQGK